MRGATFGAVLALVAACVPTEPEKFPRGGVAVRFAPSEATAGAPFTSSDGWTVTLEKTALHARASVLQQAIGREDYGYGGTGSLPHIFDPRYACELRLSGLAPGPAMVAVELVAMDPRWQYNSAEESVCAVDPVTLKRFKTFADDARLTSPPDMLEPDHYVVTYGPNVYVKGSAVKDGRVVSFDLALSASSVSTRSTVGELDENGVWHPLDPDDGSSVNIVANQGTPARFEVHFESLFAGGIEPLAAADADGDGEVTAEELYAVALACDSTNASSSSSSSSSGSFGDDDDDFGYDDFPPELRCPTLLNQLARQASSVLWVKPTR